MNGEQNEPRKDENQGKSEDPPGTESTPPTGIIPLAAAAFAGGLLGAIIGSALS